MPKSINESILYSSLFLLTFVTGIVDAASFISMGHVFTANMTGNVVFLGFAFAGVPSLSISRSLTALAAAVLGGLLAGCLDLWLVEKKKNHCLAAALVIEAVLLGGAAVTALQLPESKDLDVWPMYVIIALTAFGMGVRNGTIRRLAVPELTTTVLTLTIAALGFDLSSGPGGNPRWKRRIGAILTMFGGAYVGALLLRYSLTMTLGVAGLLTMLSAGAQLYREETELEQKLAPRKPHAA